jgi:hypothetical protein
MFIIQKIDGAYGAYRYVAANYETTLSYKDALVFETDEGAKKYLSSLQKGNNFYNKYYVLHVLSGRVPQTPAPAAEQAQLDMFATPPTKTKKTTPKTKNPI